MNNGTYINETLEAMRAELVTESDTMNEQCNWTKETEMRQSEIMDRIKGIDELRIIYDEHIQRDVLKLAGEKEDIFGLMGKIFAPSK